MHKQELEPPQLQRSQAPGQFYRGDVEFLILRQDRGQGNSLAINYSKGNQEESSGQWPRYQDGEMLDIEEMKEGW